MRKLITVLFVTAILGGVAFGNPDSRKASSDEVRFTFKGNPLVRHMFTADPSARVFDGKVYVYTSHDNAKSVYFDMTDWHVFSSDDMVHWTDHGAIMGLDDIVWADSMAWAPDCVKRGDKYYFYYPVERTKIGVAVSDSPVTGFVDSGKPLIDNEGRTDEIGVEPIDPVVLIDEDGQAYMYFGCRNFRMVRLKENMVETTGPVEKPVIVGNENDAENFGGYYGEGPFVFKREGKYYLVYSNGWGVESTLVYAMADSPAGPFTYIGAVMDPVSSFTSHGSLVEFKGQWYVFYHTQDLPGGNGVRRSVCFDKIGFDENGLIIKATQTIADDITVNNAKTGPLN